MLRNNKETTFKPRGIPTPVTTKPKKLSSKTFLSNPIRPGFDFTKRMSWSAFSCFNNPDYPEFSNREKWYERYVLKIQEPPTPQLVFGSMIDKKIQADRSFLPQLERFPVMQFEMKPYLNTIPLIGYADGFDRDKLRLKDDKTGVTPWTQERANKTGQLTMYLLMLHLEYGIHPEKVQCQIDWIPTMKKSDGSIALVDPPRVETFYTKRTMLDLMKFMNYIEETYKQMQEYVKNHK